MKPTQHLIGTTAAGEIATSAAKEYPSALNLSFARAFAQKLAAAPWSPDQIAADAYGLD